MIKITQAELDCIDHIGVNCDTDAQATKLSKKIMSILYNNSIYGTRDSEDNNAGVSTPENDRTQTEDLRSTDTDIVTGNKKS